MSSLREFADSRPFWELPKRYMRPAPAKCLIPDCGGKHWARGLCKSHYSRLWSHGDPMPDVPLKKQDGRGKPRTTVMGYVITKRNQKIYWQHREVMESILGRPLRPNENVHHKNGVRHDNRPENLELWVKSQPSGQRPQDLVAWAKEILKLYGDQDV